ncbi:MAG: hypothetical protein L0L57_05330 [Alkalibacterium sp.]|nr:hypothetical protein [Tetragenococcus koreensis]MDN6729576.1 hypothetical protein [Alkalibacterium sp.]
MEQETKEILSNKASNLIMRLKSINHSIKNHLSPEYRKQNIIKRFLSCFFLHMMGTLLGTLFLVSSFGDFDILSNIAIVASFFYSFIAWLFWPYAFWSFKGGVIDNLANSIIYFGSIWSVLGKIFLQNFVVLVWIAFISPISGVLTWRKAVKHDKYLYLDNDKSNVWE